MKPDVTPFTAVYTQWLDSFRAMLPGYAPEAPAEQPALTTLKKEQIAANEEWEHEGGSIKPAPNSEARDAPKIPF